MNVTDDSTVNLAGGTIEVGDLNLDGTMNIEPGGTLILDGNKITKVFDLVYSGKLTGCGSARGIIADYGVTNPGKTTVHVGNCMGDPCQAWGPVPADGATEVRPGLTTGGITLCWHEGDCLGVRGRNSVYFGTDFNDINDATTNDPILWQGFFQFRGGDSCWYAGILPLWETFYWRIDEFNGIEEVEPVTKGQVWSFTTGCELIDGDINMDCLVNFLDFAELASTFGQEEFWPE
jgi:hypothetical protein